MFIAQFYNCRTADDDREEGAASISSECFEDFHVPLYGEANEV
jgi:hypothetical protein